MNRWNNRRVLVTGAGGFIGSHLAEALTKKGAQVRAMVHYRGNGSAGWLDGSAQKEDMDILPGDIRDTDFVRRAIKNTDVVFHLAALIGIPYSYEAPESYISTNIGGTLNVLQAARLHGVTRIVHTSTSEVYGTSKCVPIRETHPLQAQSPYSASKIGADKIAESFFLSFNTPVVTVRPFNTFGPRQSARAVIPTMISQLLNGNSVSLGNLYPRRDFTFVQDTVEGFLLAAESSNTVGKTVNLGSGEEIRIKDLLMRIARILGKKPEWTLDKKRIRPKHSEVDRLVADNSLARRLTGWRPRMSLNDGLQITIGWIHDNLSHFQSGRYGL